MARYAAGEHRYPRSHPYSDGVTASNVRVREAHFSAGVNVVVRGPRLIVKAMSSALVVVGTDMLDTDSCPEYVLRTSTTILELGSWVGSERQG
ncbi:hypothetical protein VFPPC_16879 [Pochonia chlamydosporia 170]|uniref:Uncharacterized protein n=1 Tax=Pochonia chlamydosporia 170 TaxID=1380566 RepID=A0A179F1X4_METCM|nr:hypothetical protein VFPPC_16879 [Pochonia chlamydosporia 170]OAQ59457.1 hypothetical protein VFPPC_16879 [Pochonia chlamydosporia 170]